MKERPIIFNAPMVRAILEGRKTQTRRVVKPQPNRGSELTRMQDGYADGFIRAVFAQDDEPNAYGIRCHYGERGDRLWCKETWCVGNPFDNISPSNLPGLNDGTRWAVDYAANPKRVWHQDYQGKWRPSIHMPRWASRITLEITAVRVERLQDISEEDAEAEGVYEYIGEPQVECDGQVLHFPDASFVRGYLSVWESIHGPGSWAANPFVWVLEFKRVEEQA